MASVPVLLYSSRIDYVDDDVDGVVADDDVGCRCGGHNDEKVSVVMARDDDNIQGTKHRCRAVVAGFHSPRGGGGRKRGLHNAIGGPGKQQRCDKP